MIYYRLEQALTHYACLSVGDAIAINYNGDEYSFDVEQCLPDPNVCIIDADIKFEFSEPRDYQAIVRIFTLS